MNAHYPDLGRTRLAVAMAILLIFAWAGQSRASWTVDPVRRHVSVHAALSCTDCHGDKVGNANHPDPADVNKPRAAFFNPESCLTCHGDVAGALSRGLHAGKPLEHGRDYRACVSCHNPHYEIAGKRPAAFDPSRPVQTQCGACHPKKDALPPPPEDAASCLLCHGASGAARQVSLPSETRLCLSCHGQNQLRGAGLATLGVRDLAAASHKTLACTDCHRAADGFPHSAQTRAACLSCHVRHDSSVANDAHLGVDCEACHLQGVTPVRVKNRVTTRIDRAGGASLAVHAMGLPEDRTSCARCHVPDNVVGASALALPAKSVLCSPCHAATFTVADTTSGVSLAAFLGGLALLAAFWFSGARLAPETSPDPVRREQPDSAHEAGGKVPTRLASALFFDIFLQRRLYRESPGRWGVHALIFFPFVVRFLWGMAGLLGSLWTPGERWPWLLLDRNYPLGGLLFDVSGLALLAGLLLAAAGWIRGQGGKGVSGMPRRDWPALGLLLALVVAGFVLEGLRIAMTGMPAGSGYAFAGYALARLFQSASAGTLADVHGIAWHVHAILTGAVAAYTPFSQLRHALTAPLALLLGALNRRG